LFFQFEHLNGAPFSGHFELLRFEANFDFSVFFSYILELAESLAEAAFVLGLVAHEDPQRIGGDEGSLRREPAVLETQGAGTKPVRTWGTWNLLGNLLTWGDGETWPHRLF
jgi:hypothetical protein